LEPALPDWRPDLSSDGQPAYAQIADALAADVARGALAVGARLPTQRALALDLGLAIGTVSRGYAEAERRGLIEAVVGRGSFVAGPVAASPESDGLIDLARNVAPLGPATAAFRRTVLTLARRPDLAQRLDYAPDGGFEADRRAAQAWLRRSAHYAGADARRLIMTAGAQQAISVALTTLCRPGEAVIVEAATFHGVRLAAAHLGLTVAPAEMDAEGLTPAALDRLAAETGARAAYVQPFQNPTARVMSLARRQEILAVARRRGLVLIEDDLYGPHVADLGLPPLAELAPDQVAYVSGLSKSLAPGFRTGFLAVPDRHRTPALEVLRAQAFGSPTFGAALASEWIESGEAYDVADAVRAELGRRAAIAKRVLAGLIEPVRQRASPHVWLPLGELEAERVAGLAMRAGVKITSPRAPFADDVPTSGLRICLGAAPDLATLERGLEVVRDATRPARALAEAVV
jgi:DNA-binding transcriptional MocR family regulator